ncbi:hypothetical protein EKD00_01865 [Chlorobium phaeovibrioides]|uniref:hypothetical protein n=1 Tax=Chlorobium phaeovibrioides TaxID=1094 RepID=UPI000F837853|nr:hypothetical protein [Chlorobium phaeovibrioides]RTY36514.1 hypothetical protein EKD00_01865 [Chlorobium phaeovibrioides]
MDFWRRYFRQITLPVHFAVELEGGGEENANANEPGNAGGGEGAGEDGGEGNKGNEEGGEGRPKSFSQAEVDALIAKKTAIYSGIDVQEYKALKEARAKQEREALEKKGDFDKILAQTMKEKDEIITEKNGEIGALEDQLTRIRVDNTLLEAASGAKAVNPRQIVTLLKGNVHYDRKTDSVEVRENGTPLYKSGKPVNVSDYVYDFLAKNAHFMPAGPSGSGASGGGAGVPAGSIYKISALDAKDPAKYRAARETAIKAGQSLSIER